MSSLFSRTVQQLKAGWAGKSPVLLFVLFFFGIMAVFYAFMQTSFYQHSFQPFIVRINAQVASFLLNILGQGTHASGDLIASNRASISIKRGCDALVPIFLFCAALLAFPAKWRYKGVGLGVGVAFLLLVNIIRIINLYWVKLYYPNAFDIMHLEVWQVIFILLGILCWAVWMQWTQKKVLAQKSRQD